MRDINWDLVGPSLKAGRYNLLLGAGVSLDSISGIPSEKCPSAGTLRNILQRELPDVRDGSSLNRLFRAMTDEQTESLITKRFSLCQPGPSVEAITKFRWRRIFTLNVDDALEAAYDKNKATALQSYVPFNYIDAYEDLRELDVVPIIHLHGWAQRPQDKYIFDIKEYMGSVSNHNLWARNLASFIRSEPFFVIGSSLEEPDLTYFMSDRFNVEHRSDRAPSILVEYYPDKTTEKDCAEYKMALFPGDALSFLKDLNDRFPARPTVHDTVRDNLGDWANLEVDAHSLSEFNADFERVPNKKISGDDGGTNFAYGYRPTWIDIQNERDVPRQELVSLFSQVTKSTGATIPIISGGAGSGKTTLLTRLAWNIAQAGNTCLWIRAVGRIRVESATKILNALPGNVFVFVDNLADNIREVIAIRRSLPSKRIVFVGAERTYRLSHVVRIAGNAFIQNHPLGPIGDLEEPLLRAYRNYGLAVGRQQDSNKLPLKGELIAIACCRILNNFEPLSSIVDRSLRDAPFHAECYVFSALASYCYRIGIEYDLIDAQFPGYQIDIQDDPDAALPLKVATTFNTDFVTPRNEAFSDTILARYANSQPNEMLDVFIKLAHAIRPRVSVKAMVKGEPCARIASRLFDFDEVVKPLLGIDGGGAFYAQTKTEWDWNSRYWHQIAQYRLELAFSHIDPVQRRFEADRAVQHARFAKTIEAGHQFTLTTIGRVIFGKSRLFGEMAADDLKEGIEALCEAIRVERRKNRVSVHPFMILFRGLSDCIEIGAILSNDQRATVQAQLDLAAVEFGRDRDLMTEAERLRRLL